MTLGDRVAVMRDGVLQQFDVPQTLYDRPVNLFVAEFIGSPAMNLVGADLERENGTLFARFGEHRLRVDDEVLSARPDLKRFEGKPLILGIRPEDLEDAELASEAPADRRFSAQIDIREDMGSEVYVHFGSGGRPVRGKDVAAAIGEEAIEATEAQTKGKGSLFVARVGRTSRAREGGKVDLLVTTPRLHFFDPETGLGIYDGAEESG
jgi:multiple sugar transport system ATP-binding protein